MRCGVKLVTEAGLGQAATAPAEFGYDMRHLISKEGPKRSTGQLCLTINQ